MNANVKVGFFVLVVLAVFMYFTLTITRGGGLIRRDWNRYEIDFKNIGTLEKGAPVKQAGYTIGEVVDISPAIRPGELEREFVVRIEIEVGPDARVNTDSSITIEGMGMMGEKYLEIGYGSGEQADSGTMLRGTDPYDIMTEGAEIVAAVDRLLKSVDAYIAPDETREAFHGIVQNVSRLTEVMTDFVGTEESRLSEVIDNFGVASQQLVLALEGTNALIANVSGIVEENRLGISGIVRNTNETIGDVSGLVQTTSETVDVIRTKVVADAQSVAADLAAISGKLTVLIDRVDGLIQEKTPAVGETIENARATSESAMRTARDLELTMREIRQGEGLLGRFITDATWAATADSILHGASESISGASTVLGSLLNSVGETEFYYELRGFADDERFDEDETHLRNDFFLVMPMGETWSIQVGANTIGPDTSFEAQVAKSFGSVVLRAGVIESEMALGADVRLWELATLELDAIGLTHDGDERIDIHGRVPIRFVDGLAIYGGVVDVGSDDYSNLGVSWHF